MKKLLTIIALAISTITMMAEEFKIGKLTFEITSSTEVSLKSAEKDITKVYLGKTVDYLRLNIYPNRIWILCFL